MSERLPLHELAKKHDLHPNQITTWKKEFLKNGAEMKSHKTIRQIMDGKGRALDNIFIERLWRSVKYEEVYLYAYQDGKECYIGLKKYFAYYNHQRRHQSLDYEVPAAIYNLTEIKAA